MNNHSKKNECSDSFIDSIQNNIENDCPTTQFNDDDFCGRDLLDNQVIIKGINFAGCAQNVIHGEKLFFLKDDVKCAMIYDYIFRI
ncbi:hypothetical protein MXB_3074 [Myxobolus squamalis]|nr:hypothetical protein MXB_3074 [Myxobolus squamalis]